MSILSIQSHVAYGHVGNAAAVFALQRLGFEVWPIMTVQLSNHTGYPGFRGRAFEAEHVHEVIHGLEELGALGGCAAVLSGYLGRAEIGEAVLSAVERTRRSNPQALFLCDPVMGDHDTGLYVPEEIVRFFQEQALPRADVVTPNAFELARLTGRPAGSLGEVLAAARGLLDLGPRIVVVTSVRSDDDLPDSVSVIAVDPSGAWRVSTPWIELVKPSSGAGDALAALFLGHYLRLPDGPERVPEAAARAAAAIYALIEETGRARSPELRLIAAQDKLVEPERLFAAEQIG